LLGLDACGFGYGLFASPCEHCIGPVGYVKFGEFYYRVRDCGKELSSVVLTAVTLQRYDKMFEVFLC
jgi:hypothetical protein